MGCRSHLKLWIALVGVGVIAAAGVWAYQWLAPRGDTRLRAFVHAKPPVPIVFTSRSEPASLEAAAPAGEGFTFPGQPLWQAKEGRLRILHPSGDVHELTWEKPLPDGGTLIDVMSPSVSPDAQKIVFAGRRGGSDHGHFRIYEIAIDGTGLRPLTGLPDDPGCTALPPMRSRGPVLGSPLFEALVSTTGAAPANLGIAAAAVELAQRGALSADDRRTIDYDDVDPVYMANGDIAFISSRHPDLGRDHSRRATQLWLRKPDGTILPYTANRNNDRWPFQCVSGHLVFSSWSRNREVITADLRDVVPYEPGGTYATAPTDRWVGAMIEAAGTRFGHLVKLPISVWRPRPLFNHRFAFMTPFALQRDERGVAKEGSTVPGLLQVVQCEAGLVTEILSARGLDDPLPRQDVDRLAFSTPQDEKGRLVSLATPSPCPVRKVLLAGAAVESGQPLEASRYGIYLAAEGWWQGDGAAPSLLFDDPGLVDAEPVAVYVRPVHFDPPAKQAGDKPRTQGRLATGVRAYDGPIGFLSNMGITVGQNDDAPGQRCDNQAGPILAGPPTFLLDSLRFYAARRDAFSDPVFPRIHGSWELLHTAPVQIDLVDTALPSGIPFVLVGFTKDGTVGRWTTVADSTGRHARFFALAGDHYSTVKTGTYTSCSGCHPGHSGTAFKGLTERLK